MRTVFLIAIIAVLAVGGYFIYNKYFPKSYDFTDINPYTEYNKETGIYEIDEFLSAVLSRTDLPAVGAIVVNQDQIVAAGFQGVRSRFDTQRVELDDSVHIGSLTKAMTAVLAAMLVEEGVISWDQSVTDAFPDLAAAADPAWENVTLEKLLKMNAGIERTDAARDVFNKWLNSSDRSSDPVRQRSEAVIALLSSPPASEVGADVSYSNYSYVLAGHMLETAAGRSYEELTATYLFSALGFTSAGFGAPEGANAIWGHRGREPVAPGPEADNPAMLSPAGRAHMTILEYGAYLQFILKGASGNSTLLSAESFKLLFEPAIGSSEAYAMGWEVRDDIGPNVTVLAHTGSNTAWYAYAWVAPERNIAIFAITNRGNALAEVDAIVWRLVQSEVDRRRLSAD